MKSNNRFFRILEAILITTSAIISIVIASLDLIGFFDANSEFSQRIPSLALLGIGFISGYLIIERRSKLDALANSLEETSSEIIQNITASESVIIRNLQGVEVTPFSDGAEFINAYIKRIQKAKVVKDITWGEEAPSTSKRESDLFNKYRNMVFDLASKPNVVWQEVVMFTNKNRFERTKHRLSAPGYNIVFYEGTVQLSPPRLTFSIVDGEELFFYGSDLRLTVRHPDIIKFFSQYYDVIWSNGKPLKLKGEVVESEMKKLDSFYNNAT